jgi:uncharacterized membrane protein YedE/YeeE
MELNPHLLVLASIFVVAAIVGGVANRTNFCTMGAVSDWVNMGDTGRMRSWLLAIAVATAGALALEATGQVTLGASTFPPYRTANFAWLRYLLGGLLFGVGMTLASGCANKTLVRIGGGNLKSVVVLVVAGISAYLMLWTDFFQIAFMSWIGPTALDLGKHGFASQSLGDLVAGGQGGKLNAWIGFAAAAAVAAFVFSSKDFRASRDNILGGMVVGLAVVAGWYVTGGVLGKEWQDFAEMASPPPSRVAVQSFTFVSPMGDSLRYLMSPGDLSLLNFGIMALSGVIIGAFVYALAARVFRIEWFANKADFARHVAGGVLMGIGGVLAMGCTIGQAVTGVSTLAVGSILTFGAIVAGSAATMKFQYWRMLREGG